MTPAGGGWLLSGRETPLESSSRWLRLENRRSVLSESFRSIAGGTLPRSCSAEAWSVMKQQGHSTLSAEADERNVCHASRADQESIQSSIAEAGMEIGAVA